MLANCLLWAQQHLQIIRRWGEKLIKIFWNQIDQLNARLIEHCNLLKMFDVNGKKSIYRWWIENWISASPQKCSHGSSCFAVRHSLLCSCWPETFIGFKYNVSVFHTILASLLLLLGICVLILCLKFLCAFILPSQRVESSLGSCGSCGFCGRLSAHVSQLFRFSFCFFSSARPFWSVSHRARCAWPSRLTYPH